MEKSRPNKKRRKPSPTRKSRPSNADNRRPQARKGGRKPSTLNPDLLERKATAVEIKEYRSERSISELPIHHRIKTNLSEKGFERPTEIQDRTLEALLDGKDLLGIAQTGTGKTGAFLIPIIDQLLHDDRRSYALILVPTRELAVQVEDEFKSMSAGLKLYSACFIGGTNINRDLYELRRKSHIVIATPGRLLDLVNRGAMDLRHFHTLVLDEFDRMLDMGFVHDVKRIINGMQRRQHSLLFSATLDTAQRSLINEILTDQVTVKVSSGQSTSDNVDQEVIRLKDGQDKFVILLKLLEDEAAERVLLFEETKHKVKRLCAKLNKSGISAAEIHGNKSQNARQDALESFKKGKVRVLVATDVAARGIDVADVSHVINYQVPQTMDSYIHRIGRTGRAGKPGKAYTFVP